MIPWIHLFKPTVSESLVYRVFPDLIESGENTIFFVLLRSDLKYFRRGKRRFHSSDKGGLRPPRQFLTSREAVEDWLDRRAKADPSLDGGLIAWQATVARDKAIGMPFELATASGKILGYTIIPHRYRSRAAGTTSGVVRA